MQAAPAASSVGPEIGHVLAGARSASLRRRMPRFVARRFRPPRACAMLAARIPPASARA